MGGGSDEGTAGASGLTLEQFLRVLPNLDAADLMAISAAYQQAEADPRVAARAAASIVARQRGLGDELSRLQGAIIQWAGSDISRSSAFTLEALATNPMLGDLRIEAVPPLLDAATALLLNDGLTDEERTLLLEPVALVWG